MISKEQFVKLSKEGNLIPVCKELTADKQTAVGAFQKISKDSRFAYLLESVEGGDKWARYTFLGADPELVIKTSGGKGTRITPDGEEQFELDGDPLDEIKKVMAGYKPVGTEDMPIFFGGAVGYIGYDTVRFFEKLPEMAVDDAGMPEMVMMITDTLLIFDNVSQKIKVIVNAHLGGDKSVDDVYSDAVAKIDKLVAKLEEELKEEKVLSDFSKLEYSSNTEKEKYKESVAKCKEYIKEGDIFQVVLAQRLSIKLDIPAFEVYKVLRTLNPSPYMYYLKLDDWEVVGASPEILSRAEDGKVTVRPIAGTRPRGKTEAEDIAYEKELLQDEKELAEHLMLIDLGRNDVGRIAKAGTVRVTDLKIIERYSHVMHIVSNVEGELEDGKDSFDVIRATFPAGTLSGAPKIRAMEIIDELEPNRRGLYGGAVGYFGFSGNMDTAIAIRTLAIKGGIAYLGIGAGIVADSDPEKEWEETMNKGRALIKALEIALSSD